MIYIDYIIYIIHIYYTYIYMDCNQFHFKYLFNITIRYQDRSMKKLTFLQACLLISKLMADSSIWAKGGEEGLFSKSENKSK